MHRAHAYPKEAHIVNDGVMAHGSRVTQQDEQRCDDAKVKRDIDL